ncbi:MAG: selenocysteine-specific translation elongation factor [Pseudomonadota bacterium]|nr:selenocysteine-specific translation elongation factor [Pseudomonadota bacterium]
MIIATAGHVDHGKTLLIKALTGVDTDRLPEEKKRNLTIDLGFAYLPIAGAETIGFIDVPGHERFIRNMLCGVAGIDFVLFIVAADDGPMPQTEEHLAILDLLGVNRGAVALTKIDRVSDERTTEVEKQIDLLFADTTLEGLPVFPVSAVTGKGVNGLKAHLLHAAANSPLRPLTGNFRLSIDRSFHVVGAGLVVTGTAFSGQIETGTAARVLGAEMDVRIRSIHAQNEKEVTGRAGQRCALNLAGTGLEKKLIRRGDWVVTGTPPPPVRKLDIRLRVLNSETRPLAHWTPVHVHLGAAETTGRVAILGASNIPVGKSGLAQLILDHPVGAVFGDRLIIRNQSAKRTVAGGRVIDVFPPKRGRSKPDRLQFLDAMEEPDDGIALSTIINTTATGVNLGRFATTRNLTTDDMEILVDLVPMKTIATADTTLGFSNGHWSALRTSISEGLAAWHRRSPDTVGPGENRILAGTGIHLTTEMATAISSELVREGVIIKEGMGIRLPSHRPSLQGADATNWKIIKPILLEAGLRPPVVVDIARHTGKEPKKVESLLVRAGRHGLVVRVTKNRFYPPETLHSLRMIAEEVAAKAEDGMITAANFRDASNIGRNLSIEILEFFDRIKFTRRVGDGHEVIRSAKEAFGGK